MKKHLRKIAIVLTICMCLPLFAACDVSSLFGAVQQPSVSTDVKDDEKAPEIDDDFLPEGLELGLGDDGNSYKVTDYSGDSIDVVIPETYNGFPVTEIDEKAFSGSKKLISVVIPDSVEIIGDSAFKNCQSLEYVTIGEYESMLSKIGKQAFQGCEALDFIEFVGYEDTWNAIEKGKDWDKNVGKKTDDKTYEMVFIEPTEPPVETEPIETQPEYTEPEYTDVFGSETEEVSRPADETEIPDSGECKHDKITIPGVAPTCTEKGYLEGIMCAKCGIMLTVQMEIPALGHMWDEGKVSDNASCGTPLDITYTCKTCGEKRVEAGNIVTEHSVRSWSFYDDSLSDTDTALETGVCVNCGAAMIRNADFRSCVDKINGVAITPKVGHAMGSPVTVNATELGFTADDDGRISVLGWIISNTNMTKMVYKVGSSEWKQLNADLVSRTDVANINASSNWGFVSETAKGFNQVKVDLSEYEGETITVTLAVIADDAPYGSNDIYIPFCEIVELYVPEIIPEETEPEDLYWSAEEIFNTNMVAVYTSTEGGTGKQEKPTLELYDNYIRIIKEEKEGYAAQEVYGMLMSGGTQTSGKYLVIKYRIPTGGTPALRFFAATTQSSNKGPMGTNDHISATGHADSKWHIAVIDASTYSSQYIANSDGTYSISYLRVNYVNGVNTTHVDVGFVAVCDNIKEAVMLDNSVSEVEYYEKGKDVAYYDPATGNKITNGMTNQDGLEMIEADEILENAKITSSGIEKTGYNENGLEFVRFELTADVRGEAYIYLAGNGMPIVECGSKYFAVMYRMSSRCVSNVDIYISNTTSIGGQNGGHCTFTPDGEWHIAVLDVSSISVVDASAAMKLLRVDIFNGSTPAGEYVDIACAGFFSDRALIDEFFSEGNFGVQVAPLFTVNLDSVHCTLDGEQISNSGNRVTDAPVQISAANKSGGSVLTVGGWCVTPGGIESLVYRVHSNSNGSTSEETFLYNPVTVSAENGIAAYGLSQGYGEDCRNGCAFQTKARIDLSEYAGDTVSVEIIMITNEGKQATIAWVNDILVIAQ